MKAYINILAISFTSHLLSAHVNNKILWSNTKTYNLINSFNKHHFLILLQVWTKYIIKFLIKKTYVRLTSFYIRLCWSSSEEPLNGHRNGSSLSYVNTSTRYQKGPKAKKKYVDKPKGACPFVNWNNLSHKKDSMRSWLNSISTILNLFWLHLRSFLIFFVFFPDFLLSFKAYIKF